LSSRWRPRARDPRRGCNAMAKATTRCRLLSHSTANTSSLPHLDALGGSSSKSACRHSFTPMRLKAPAAGGGRVRCLQQTSHSKHSELPCLGAWGPCGDKRFPHPFCVAFLNNNRNFWASGPLVGTPDLAPCLVSPACIPLLRKSYTPSGVAGADLKS